MAVTSVRLSWNKPAGNLDFYLVKVQGGKEIRSVKEGAEVGGLIPGTLYKFTVLSGVEGNSTWSEESNITERTSGSHKSLYSSLQTLYRTLVPG